MYLYYNGGYITIHIFSKFIKLYTEKESVFCLKVYLNKPNPKKMTIQVSMISTKDHRERSSSRLDIYTYILYWIYKWNYPVGKVSFQKNSDKIGKKIQMTPSYIKRHLTSLAMREMLKLGDIR